MITKQREKPSSGISLRKFYKFILIFFMFYLSSRVDILGANALTGRTSKPINPSDQPKDSPKVFLPIVFARFTQVEQTRYPIVNIPYFDGDILYEQTAVFWFGKVTPTDNYTDVRIGYNEETLWVRVSVIDRRLWYDPQPSKDDLTKWDSVSLYLNLDGDGATLDSGNVYRLDAQMNWWEPRQDFQAAYRGTTTGWVDFPLLFMTQSLWWGFPQPNDNNDDRAWVVAYSIPFQSLGLTSMPVQGNRWGLAVQIHDRDDSIGSPIPDQVWPRIMTPEQTGTWGQIRFGLPVYTPRSSRAVQTVSIRNGYQGTTVKDGVVGGNTECGYGVEFWSIWGNQTYLGIRDVNVQNQGNTDDWPCFSKYYITFPLDSLPPGKDIITATLTLHQSGNAIGFDNDPPKALNSLIQVFRVGEDWDPATLSWNNGPLALENVSQAWVGSITMRDLGIPRAWDVSRVVTRAYSAGEPLRLVLYSADYYGPHGKYFFSSSSDDYNGAFRPQLDVVLGDPN